MTDVSRRVFMQWAAGAGAATSGALAGKAVEKLIPCVIPPTETRAGVWNLLATTCRECPAGCGLHLRHMDGRAIKAEGNPGHPINQGALCARGQSCVQGLYDPDRLRQPLYGPPDGAPRPTDWPTALRAVSALLRRGAGRVAVLSDLQTGSLAEVLEQFTRTFGSQPLLMVEPFNYEALRTAHDRVFGLPIIPEYRLASCDLILSFAADFLETWISPVQFASAFATAHAYADGRRGRLVYVGPRLSMTAANADDVVRVPPGTERWVALGMLKLLAERGWGQDPVGRIAAQVKAVDLPSVAARTGVSVARLEALAKAWAEARSSVALAGPTGAAGSAAIDTAVAAALLNQMAGRNGSPVALHRAHALSRTARQDETQRFLAGLTAQDVVLVHGANPAYTLPGAAAALRRAAAVIYLGTHLDETAELARWRLPVDSPLESWGDYEPYAGVDGLLQPTTARLHDTRAAGDVLLALAAGAGQRLARAGAPASDATFAAWVRARWQDVARRVAPAQPFEEFWDDALRRGGCWRETDADVSPLPEPAADLKMTVPGVGAATLVPHTVALWVWPSIMLFDGRVANRGWLQEAPDPLSSLVWGSSVELHPQTARRLGVADGDVVELENESGKVQAPVRITDDVAEEVAALALGQGHTALGRHAARRGANAFALLGRVPAESSFGAVRLRKAGPRAETIATCATQDQQHREIVRWVELAALQERRPGAVPPLILPLPEGYDPHRDLYAPHAYPQHRWAMAVDLDRCTGCGACAVACYAENNLAVVGPEQTRRGRMMAWLRVVPYRDEADPRRVGFLPLMCQHCDAAPCEPVCPVYASVHNDEGLNAQIYNRCIGTRYCSHNCPYKVRRFNWQNHTWPAPLDRQLNPEVTVRCRGVMEKCTFCIQRIREVERLAKRENRPVRDGEIQPACVQTCPTRALIFGDLLAPGSRVAELTRRDVRRYHVLEELNTKPAVVYLQRVKAGGRG